MEVNPLDQYTISFKSLKLGNHEFDFEVKDAFFEADPGTEIHHGEVKVHITLIKEERMMILNFSLAGSVTVACDRCNGPLTMSLDGQERLIVKLGEDYEEESDEVLIIPETAYQIDVAPFIHDYLHLLLPMRRIHDEDAPEGQGCDAEVLKKLEDLNRRESADPRWEALKKLKDNSEK